MIDYYAWVLGADGLKELHRGRFPQGRCWLSFRMHQDASGKVLERAVSSYVPIFF